ncbi:MAG: hypothetical protein E5299_00162 [Burkholderia gladioli]|nr:MAG: hypothetical protein E5299_00162 [Burkholderia gladioli]
MGTVTADHIDLFFARNLVEQLGQNVTVSHILISHQRCMRLTHILALRAIWTLRHVRRFE